MPSLFAFTFTFARCRHLLRPLLLLLLLLAIVLLWGAEAIPQVAPTDAPETDDPARQSRSVFFLRALVSALLAFVAILIPATVFLRLSRQRNQPPKHSRQHHHQQQQQQQQQQPSFPPVASSRDNNLRDNNADS